MTIKEITELRKSGHLEEALQSAEAEFASYANNYTAGALFWCLNDKCKIEADHETIEELYERMKSLHEEYCPQDEYMPKSLTGIEKRLDPLGAKIKDSLESAKNGHVDEGVLSEIKNKFDNGNLSESLYADYGWLIYYTLKNTPLNDVDKRKRHLHNYLKLNLLRPALLHSLILGEAVKVEKNTPLQFRIRDFMTIWGWENLREVDWQQYKSDNGHTIPSLVENLISVFAKELKTDGVPAPEAFQTIVDKALDIYPGSLYMPFYKATVLRSLGKNEEALEYYRQLILRLPSKCYLWHQASALLEDPELKIAFLCKAIEVERDEAFKGNCRLDLAKILAEKSLYANARQELTLYSNYYTSQGWSLKSNFRDLEIRIPASIQAQGNQSLYQEYTPKAENFIYNTLPSVLAIKLSDRQVDDKNRPGRKFIQWTLRTKAKTLYLKKPQKFGLDGKMPNGSVFEVKIHEEKIVWIAKSGQNPLLQDWIKATEGSVRLRTDRNGNPYAILDGIYVGRKFLNGIVESQRIKIVGLLQDDGRWSAISLKKL